MRLYNYRKTEYYTIASDIRKVKLGLTQEQDSKLENILDNYLILRYAKKENKRSPLIRFTIPFYPIAWLLTVLILSPIKWMVTGDYYWKYDSTVVRFLESWWKKF